MVTTADRMRKAANLMVSAGLTVKYSSGWESRGRPYSFHPTVGFVDHHTAATSDIDNVLINGRSDLPGPLCHWALHKNGDWVLIAAGYANHAGESQQGAPTNSSGWGCEATGPIPLDGYGPGAFPNYNSYVTGMACILEAEKWGTSKIWGHKESCYPSGRKIDPSFHMPDFRAKVEHCSISGEDEDLPLNDADKKWIRQTIHDAIYYHNLVVTSGGSNSQINKDTYPEYFDGHHPSNQAIIDQTS
jgi:hypothetical protein